MSTQISISRPIKLEINTTPITGGVSGLALYNNAGILGELNLSSIYVPLARTLTINGTTQDLSADRAFTVSTGITIGTTAITSGVVGRVLFEGAGNVVQESANLFWDNVNGRLGIGGTPGAFNLDVVGTARVNGNSYFATTGNGGNGVGIGTTSLGTIDANQRILQVNANLFSTLNLNAGNGTVISTFTCNCSSLWLYAGTTTNHPFVFVTNDTARARFSASTGNLLINTTTDAGFKLDVNGTARVQASIQIGGSSLQGGINATDGSYTLNYTTTTANGKLKISGVYPSFDITNTAGSLRVRLNNEGSQGTLTLYQNSVSNIFLNGSSSDNNSYIATALSIGNQSAANASSILEVSSTTKGFLPPRMTTTQKNAIATPATGLMVYDTTLNLMALYNGTIWTTL